MAQFNKYHALTSAIFSAKHDFTTHAFKVAFSNTAPNVAHTTLAQIGEIAPGGGYVAGGLQLDNVSLVSDAGDSKVIINDEVFTATSETSPFRYVILYNDTSAGDLVLGWYDYGASITLKEGESLTLDFDGTNGVLSLGQQV